MNTTPHEVPAPLEAAPRPEAPKPEPRPVAPRVDVTETPDAFLVTADVPGVAMDAIDITVEENRLEFFARRERAVYEGHRAAFRQYGEGGYRRAFSIPEDTQRDGIRADLRDGVLRITLPKAEPTRAQKIQVEVG